MGEMAALLNDAGKYDDIEVGAVDIDDPDLDPVAHGFANREAFDAFVQEGLDDVAAGRVVSHEVIKADIAAMRADSVGGE